MSKKNTNYRISYGQYKAADILIFLIILCLCEIVNILALKQWFSGKVDYAVSVMLLISLVVMIRWGWLGVIFPVLDGILYCWLNEATMAQYVIYAAGNAFVVLVCVLFIFLPKDKITDKWWLTLIYALLGYVLMILGRALVSLFYHYNFWTMFSSMAAAELLNLFFAVAGLLVFRKITNLLVDQKKYLIQVTTERDTIKPPDEYHWDGYTELDAEDLERLKAMDEYDRKVTFNHTTLKSIKEDSGEDIIPDDVGGDIYEDLTGGELYSADDDEEEDNELSDLAKLDSGAQSL